MGILDRLDLLVRANLNNALSDDRESARSTLREMERSMRDARKQHAQLRRDEQRLVDQIRAARDRADDWEERAILALRNDEEDLAREALSVKNQTLREVSTLRDELDELRTTMADIERALEALEMKLEGTRGRMRARSSGRSRSRRDRGGSGGRNVRDWDAEMERRLRDREDEGGARSEPRDRRSRDRRSEDRGSAREDRDRRESRRRDAERWRDEDRSRRRSDRDRDRSGPTSRTATEYDEVFSLDDSFSEFDRMSSKIDSMEAEIEAFRELSGDDWADPRRKELEDIFDRMERKKKSGDDLSDLKKKFE